MIRLDKYLADLGFGTRTQVKELIRKGAVCVEGAVQKSPEYKLDEKQAKVSVNGVPCLYERYRYYLLHKPAGVISATEDKREKTVLSFLPKELRKDIFPVGRLDKDTTGLLLLTNDGELAHRLLSPGKHVEKTYLATLEKEVSEEDLRKLAEGVDIGEKKKTLPAHAEYEEDRNHVLLTIQEGKFHQVKRMFEAVGNHVTALKRLSMGPLRLEGELKEGCYRTLTDRERELLAVEKRADSRPAHDFRE